MASIVTLDWHEFFNAPKTKGVKSNGQSVKGAEKRSLSGTSKVTDVARGSESAGFVLSNVTRTGALVALVALPIILISTPPVHAFTLVPVHLADGVSTSATVFHSVGTPSDSAESSGWNVLIKKVLWIVDYLMDGVIIFSGISWMFGNRTKAIELLLGSGVGYVIVRHHDDIKHFFGLL